MTMTIAYGLTGNSLQGYGYCAGEQERARRARQIEAGQLRPIWTPSKAKKKRTLKRAASMGGGSR